MPKIDALARAAGLVTIVAAASCDTRRDPSPVRVRQDALTLPTYDEGPPDPNPAFDVLGPKRLVYPYSMRDNLGTHAAPRAWRTLELENDVLRCTVLPDLGGHLYGCTDKRSGAELFYANRSIKLARVAYRGAWAAVGIEFNFPVSHSWTTTSPVDFATSTAPDGSASVWIGNVDRVYGMSWRVELTLRPGRAVLEQRTTLANPTDARHRFYYWTNAAVRSSDDTRIVYPMQFTASHGFKEVDTWPVNAAGVDLHVVGNHRDGAVSLFSHASREPYMAVVEPRARAGVAHLSSSTDLPAKKFFSWGVDADARAWWRDLSDDDSAYIEIQAGLFRNQETYGFLEPQETRSFREEWIPLHDLDDVSRVNGDAAIHLSRAPGASGVALDLALAVTRALPGAVVILRDGARVVSAERAALSPAATFRRRWADLPATPAYTVELLDASGSSLIQHTEGSYDLAPASTVKTGPQAPVAPSAAGDPLGTGTAEELDGRSIAALATYERALAAAPTVDLLRAAGRVAVTLKQYAVAERHLAEALRRSSSDPEAAYYLGLAHAAQDHRREAREAFEVAQSHGPRRPAALLMLAQLSAREGDRAGALALLERLGRPYPEAAGAGAVEVALLRGAGRLVEARARLDVLRRADPTSSALRFEAVRLGAADEALLRHLAGDPERILEVAVPLLRFGLHADALDLLARPLPQSGVVAEPGMPRPEAYPLIAYYRAFCRERLGADAAADLALGARSATDLVFPNRPDSLAVLERVIARSPADATAHVLLGSLLLSGGMVEPAMRAWETARRLDPRRRVLHRNMALTLLRTGGPLDRAIALLEEGLRVDPDNRDLYLGLDEALARKGAPLDERIRSIGRFPRPEALPAALVFKLARLLADAGRFDEAENALAGRSFGREEGGDDVREVYVDVRVARVAALAAKAGGCAGARALASHLIDLPPAASFGDAALAALASSSATRKRIDVALAPCP